MRRARKTIAQAPMSPRETALIDALRGIVKAAEAWSCDEADCHECSAIHQLAELARAAIAKAEGR